MNIGTGLETSVNHLYRLLAEITGFAGEPSMGRSRRRSSADGPGHLRGPSAIGWKPWTHLEDGLAETVAYLKGI